MSETKYGKYFITELSREHPEFMKVPGPMLTISRIKERYKEANLTGGGGYYTKAFTMVPQRHVHKYDDYLFFFGINPGDPTKDLFDFDAEIELYMGENSEEKHVITKPTAVFIPAGIWHCPLVFVKVKKPVFFLHLMDHSVE